jgi:hypothetical protein
LGFRAVAPRVTLAGVEQGHGERRQAAPGSVENGRHLVSVSGQVCGVCGTPLAAENSFVDDDGRTWSVCRPCAAEGAR